MGAPRLNRLKQIVADAVNDLASVIVPSYCVVCNRPLLKGERHVCLHCLAHLPRTGICGGDFTPLHHRLASTAVCIDRVAAWFYYTQGSPYNAIITMAKYADRPSLSRMSGEIFAREISCTNFFGGIDLLQPVPLAFWKGFRRGYNQSHQIALGISAITGIPVGNLLKARPHSTQTRKDAYGRYINSLEVFSARRAATAYDNKHILLIDDVLTTGSTILACARALLTAAPGATVSVLTLGATRLS